MTSITLWQICQKRLVGVHPALPLVLRHVHRRGELLRRRRDLKILQVGLHGGDAEGRGLPADRPGIIRR